jgi:hypothetical protein
MSHSHSKRVRIIVRGFIRGAKQFEERHSVDDGTDQIERLAERHALALLALPGGENHMIEIEFPDEADPLQRFFRIGTSPDGMVNPIAVRIPREEAN